MTDLEQMIEMGNKLCANLDTMAANERKFGWMLCNELEHLSYEFYKATCNLKEIRENLGGHVL